MMWDLAVAAMSGLFVGLSFAWGDTKVRRRYRTRKLQDVLRIVRGE